MSDKPTYIYVDAKYVVPVIHHPKAECACSADGNVLDRDCVVGYLISSPQLNPT